MTVIIAGIFVIVGVAIAIFFLMKNNGHIGIENMVGALVSFGLFLGLGLGIAFGYPQYKVWEQSKAGEAALAKAT